MLDACLVLENAGLVIHLFGSHGSHLLISQELVVDRRTVNDEISSDSVDY